MNVLVTGSSGYIGSHLLNHFAGAFERCDLKEGSDFANIQGRRFDVVIHLAAQSSVTKSVADPDECFDTNVVKLAVFLSNNIVGKVVFTSSGGTIYGNKFLAKEEDVRWQDIVSPYGQSKYIAEKLIRKNPSHVILRLGNVWGGNDEERDELLAHARFKKDNPIKIYGGNQVRDFIHIDTVCKAILKATYSTYVFGTFNIGSGFGQPVIAIARGYARQRGVPLVVENARQGEVDAVSLNIMKAKQAGLL